MPSIRVSDCRVSGATRNEGWPDSPTVKQKRAIKKGKKAKMALQIVTHGHEKLIRCPVCGKEFMQQHDDDNYCSETCHRKARLQYEKPRAEKVLEKWKKELEKSQKKYRARIDKLSAAINSNDPEAMLAARKGSLFKRSLGCLFVILQVVALLIFLVGLLAIVSPFFRDVVNHPRTDNAVTETTGTTSASTLQVGNQGEIEQVVPPNPLAKEQKEAQSVTAPIE